MKQCTRCKEIKSLSLFNKRSDRSIGHRSECKKCQYKMQYISKKSRGITRSAEKSNAYSKLHYAVRVGNLVKPINCEDCGEIKPLEGHHPDYSDPLKVKWLCLKCHNKADRYLKTETFHHEAVVMTA